MKSQVLVTCFLVGVFIQFASAQRRIAHGTNATKPPNNIPFIAQILLGGKLTCGGSIIASRTILSAAHCFCRFGKYPNLFRVSMGTDQLYTLDSHRVISTIERVFEHPNNYSQHLPCQFNIDAALVKLSSRMTFNEFIKPVKLEKEFQSNADPIMRIYGWGKTEAFVNPPRLLKLDRLYQTDFQECIETTLPMLFQYLVYISYFCYESQFRHSSDPSFAMLHRTCEGDSGSPILITRYNGEEVQVGVHTMSDSEPCDKARKSPDIAVRISAIYDWIIQTKNIIER